MADQLSHWALALMLFSALFWSSISAQSDPCPSACGCLGSTVDCSDRGLTEIPQDLPQWVTVLDIQGNQLSYIPPTAFEGFPNLRELNLNRNQLTSVNASVFSHLPGLQELKIGNNMLTAMPKLRLKTELRVLNLASNKIDAIDGSVLQDLPALESLDLSMNKLTEIKLGIFENNSAMQQLTLNNNKIKVLEEHTLDNLAKLEVLKISRNRLSGLPKDLFRQLKKLKFLDLSRNRFTEINGLAFKGLDNLITLKLKKNRLKAMADGAFYGLHNIQNLYLDANNISVVTKKWLYGLNKVQLLSLSHNAISNISKGSWECCPMLQQLDLSSNRLTTIVEDSTFHLLPLLRVLTLTNNQISYIAGGAFRSMGNLEVLELAGNEISWTIDMNAAFEGLTSLLQLDLNNNHIKSISTTSFSGLVQLRHLQLVNNNITSIQEDAFADLVSLEQIKFNTSTLLCDCQLKWLPIWLQQKQFEAMVSARCGHPRTLQGSSILDVSQEDFTCTDFPKPVMVTEPTAVIALKGNNMSLSCAVQSSSDSPMKAEWRKNSVPMHNANVENFASLRNDNVIKLTSILHLTHVQDVDSGSYQCIVTNQFGSVFSKKARVNVYVYPVFTKTPLDVSVKAGKTARLECAAHGEPQPEVFWQKDGGEDFPAARERRMMFAREDDVFFILKVSSLDQGLYSCMARNGAGTIIANATLTVFENPSFVKPMEDKQTKVGETTVLECLAAGSPKPKLTWLKNDKPLGVTERHFFTANDQLLVIVQTRPEDAGRYTCEMSNTLGMERGTSQLTVINLESPSPGNNGGGLDDESTTTGIIIIAVVCCVVGTSLVWVIIIYQTRKRSDTYSSTPTDETTLPGDLTPYNPSDEERESSKSDQFLEYQGHVLPMFQSHPRYAKAECGRSAAIFPSDVEDDDLKQSVPLTCDEHQPAAESEHSINSLSLPSSASDSSSPSTRSTSSTGLNSLQTFNPHPNKLANHNGVRDRSPSPVAMIHQPPQWFNASSLPHTRSTADSYHCSKSPTDNPESPAPHTASLPQYSCVPGHNSHTTSHTLPIPYEDLYPDSEVHPNHHSSSASSPKSPSHHTSSNSSSHPQLSHLSSHHNIDSGDIPSENNHNHRHFDSAERRHRGRQAPPIGGRSQHRQHGGRTLSSPSQQHHRHLYVNPMDETLETAGSIPEVGLKSPSSKQKVALPHRTGDDRV